MSNPIDFSTADVGQFMGEIPSMPQAPNNNSEIERLQNLIVTLQQLEHAAATSGIEKWFVPGTPFGIENCPKHKAFFDAGKIYKERMFMAGNRCGKSIAGAYEASCHAMGIYPDWWDGARFDKPTAGWALGSTARATRDTVQRELIGTIGAWGTGMIPRQYIGDWWALAGVPQGIDIIKIKHIPTGGWSTIGFKNYEQPIKAMYGTAMDWVWADEEVPVEIYNELLLRTMTTQGLILNTFTPLNGLSLQVVRFAERADYLAGAVPLIGLPGGHDEDN